MALTPAERIKRFRARKKLKQCELAQRLGLTRSALCKIEAGSRNVSKDLAQRLAQEMGLKQWWTLL